MADENQDSGEKEFDASEQKRRQARQDGDVPQSKEVNGFTAILGIMAAAALLNVFAGKLIFERFSSMLYNADGFAADVFTSGGHQSRAWLSGVLLQVLPLFVVMGALVLIGLFITQSFSISMKKIKPDMKKLSPADNIKKKYGPRGLLDFLRDTLKMLFAGLIAAVYLFQFAQHYFASSALQKGQFATFTFTQVMWLVLAFALFQFVLAAIDLPIQHRMYANKLKMTREEMKKENKESEGDPYFKQSRREKASKISRGEMLQNVKSATVIMVNPEHYAVALKWEPESQKAPVVVAKGVDHLAAKIREVAIANSVPIYRDPPSTRSIYRLVEIDQEIHPEHFAAVAAAIQFVDRVTKAR